VAQHAPYKVAVLTVATGFEGRSALERFDETLRGARVCAVGQHRGAAGHVAIEYSSGGALLLSCGHWCELKSLDVTAERIVSVAEKTYGRARSEAMAQELGAVDPEMRSQLMQQYAREMVNQSNASRKKK
jgi:hypothetical protein